MRPTRHYIFPLLLLGFVFQPGFSQEVAEKRSLLLPDVLEIYRANGEDLVYTYNDLEQYVVKLADDNLPSLEQLLAHTPFRLIERHGKKHVIRPARYVISGRVSDIDNMGLPDANITIRGTSLGTATDSSGYFSLVHDLPRPVRVDIEYVGYRDTSFVLVHRNAVSDSLWLANIPLETEVFEAGPIVTEALTTRGRKGGDTFEDIPDWGDVSPALLALTSMKHDTKADAFHVFKIGTIRFTEDLHVVQEVRIRSKIFNLTGAKLAKVEIPYWHEDDIRGLRGITVLPDGSKIDLAKKAIKTRSDGIIHKASFELPAVQAGAVVEYEYELHSRYLMDIEPWRFSEDYFVQLSRLTARLDKGFRYAVRYQNFEYLPPSLIDKLKYRETSSATTWQLKDLHPEATVRWLNRPQHYAPALQFDFQQFTGGIILGSWADIIESKNPNSDFSELVDPSNSSRAATNFPTQAGKPMVVDRSNQGTLWRTRQNQLLNQDLQQRTQIDLTPIAKTSDKFHLPVKGQSGFYYQYSARLREGVIQDAGTSILLDQQKNGEYGLLTSSPLLDQTLGAGLDKLRVNHRSTESGNSGGNLTTYRGDFFYETPRLIFDSQSKLYQALQKPMRDARRVLRRLLNKTDSQEEKLAKTYDFVRDNFETTGRGLPVADRSLSDVLRYRKGSEIEKNLVLISLLRSAGMTAEPVLINTGMPAATTQLSDHITQFNFIIARVQLAGQSYFIDTNDHSLPWFMLSEDKWSSQGLVVNKDNAELITMKQPEELNVTHSATVMEVDSSGQILAKSRLDFGGYPALRWQKRLAGLDDFLRERRIAAWIQTNLEEWDCRITDLQSNQSSLETLHFSTLYQATNYADHHGDTLALDLPLPSFFDENPFAASSRHMPIEFPFPKVNSQVVDVLIPAGYQLTELPENQIRRHAGFEFSLSVVRIAGGVRLTRSYRLKEPHFERSSFRRMRQIIEAVMQSDELKFYLIPS